MPDGEEWRPFRRGAPRVDRSASAGEAEASTGDTGSDGRSTGGGSARPAGGGSARSTGSGSARPTGGGNARPAGAAGRPTGARSERDGRERRSGSTGGDRRGFGDRSGAPRPRTGERDNKRDNDDRRDQRSGGFAGRDGRSGSYGRGPSGANRGDDRDGQARGGQDRSGHDRSGHDRRSRGSDDRPHGGGQRSGGYGRPTNRGSDQGGRGRHEDFGSRRPTGTNRSGEDRPDEPDLPDDVTADELDPAVRRELSTLDKRNAETVARQLVMTGQLLDDDPQLALTYALAARGRASRLAVVREAVGVAAYLAGDYARALSELRAAKRMGSGNGLLAMLADSERGLGRPERAIELGRSVEARALTGDDAIELRIVLAGARADLGQHDEAIVLLQTKDLDKSRTGPTAVRLFYAYAAALSTAGRTDEAIEWFLAAAAADVDGLTDAEERVEELGGE